jgi:hypothetical protein
VSDENKTLKINVGVLMYVSVQILKDFPPIDEISTKLNDVLDRKKGKKHMLVQSIKLAKNAVFSFLYWKISYSIESITISLLSRQYIFSFKSNETMHIQYFNYI